MLTVIRSDSDQLSEVHLDSGLPPEAGAATRITEAREPVHKNQLMRALSELLG
jgi:hypothetical protein